MKKFRLILLCMGLLLIVSAFNQKERPERPQGRSEGKREFRLEQTHRALNDLKLTDEQQKKIDSIFSNNKTKFESLTKEIAENESALLNLLKSSNADSKDALKVAGELADKKKELSLQSINALFEIKAQLTEEQSAEFNKSLFSNETKMNAKKDMPPPDCDMEDGEDLFWRIAVVTFTLPPLRARRNDIEPLIYHFTAKYKVEITKEATAVLRRYDWPGNIRELENALLRAAALCYDNIVTIDDLPHYIKSNNSDIKINGYSERNNISLPEWLNYIEKSEIQKALDEADNVQVKAAELLGISERMLRYNMKKYKL